MLASQRVSASHIATSLYGTFSVNFELSYTFTFRRAYIPEERSRAHTPIEFAWAMWRMIRIMIIGHIMLESDANSNAICSIDVPTLYTLRIHCCEDHRPSLSRGRIDSRLLTEDLKGLHRLCLSQLTPHKVSQPMSWG